MGHKNPKTKGGAFEREVAKKLSLWLSDGQSADLLWRSAMSGGRHTFALKSGLMHKAQAGDLSSIDARSQQFIDTFCVECKFYKDINIKSFLFGGKSGVMSFWEQVKRDAGSVNKRPLLIVKQNFQPELICFDCLDWRAYFEQTSKSVNLLAYFPWIRVSVFSFDEFLQGFRFKG